MVPCTVPVSIGVFSLDRSEAVYVRHTLGSVSEEE